MKKVLIWIVSNNAGFFNGAMHILERQQNGLELVGVTASVEVPLFKDGKKVNFIPLDKVDRGGGI